MRVLVCGGREYSGGAELMHRELVKLSPSLVISGGARGADALAAIWAIRNHVPLMEYDADWRTHGKAAGPIRNQRMLDEGKPDLVLAFPGGRGTADMVRRARKAGVRVVEVEDDG